jgi:S-adenosylmethionine hydrolase
MSRPIVTFTTDFGLADAYVAEMKAAVLRVAPEAALVDVTHLIAPQDVLAGSIALERGVRAFPVGTIHMAVVDPGVGTDRRILLCKVAGQIVLAPDNGIITWTFRRFDRVDAYELLWRPSVPTSNTFHGRDIFAPAAGLIAAGRCEELAKSPLREPVLLNVAPAKSLNDAVVIHIDHFGNATTNVPAELLTPRMSVEGVGSMRRTYADVASGEPLALVGSSGLLEIAVRDGSAARSLRLSIGQSIKIASGGA